MDALADNSMPRSELRAVADAERRACVMKDPRHSRFYALRKRDPAQLTPQEASDVRSVCELMMEYVRDGKSRKQWRRLARQYTDIAHRKKVNREDVQCTGPTDGDTRRRCWPPR